MWSYGEQTFLLGPDCSLYGKSRFSLGGLNWMTLKSDCHPWAYSRRPLFSATLNAVCVRDALHPDAFKLLTRSHAESMVTLRGISYRFLNFTPFVNVSVTIKFPARRPLPHWASSALRAARARRTRCLLRSSWQTSGVGCGGMLRCIKCPRLQAVSFLCDSCSWRVRELGPPQVSRPARSLLSATVLHSLPI